MVKLFVRQNVADYAAWRAVYDAFESQHLALGGRTRAVYQSLDDPKNVTVDHDFDSIEAAQAFVGSAELREAMGQAGMIGDPQIWFATER